MPRSKTAQAERLAYRVKELIPLIGLSRSTLLREIYDGRLRSLKVRGVVLVPADAVQDYLSGKRETQVSGESLATAA